MVRVMRRLRYRCGRWLLRPELDRIWRHYDEAATENHRKGKHAEEQNCAYIMIGLHYAARGWSG